MGRRPFFGLNISVWVAAALIVILTIVLRKTPMCRRFCAAGANPRAAWVAGVNVSSHKLAAYIAAGLFYGIVGILLSAFIRDPTLRVGETRLWLKRNEEPIWSTRSTRRAPLETSWFAPRLKKRSLCDWASLINAPFLAAQ